MKNLHLNHWKLMTVWFGNKIIQVHNKLCMNPAAVLEILAVLYLKMKKHSKYISDLYMYT